MAAMRRRTPARARRQGEQEEGRESGEGAGERGGAGGRPCAALTTRAAWRHGASDGAVGTTSAGRARSRARSLQKKEREILQGAPCLQVSFYYNLIPQAFRNLI